MEQLYPVMLNLANRVVLVVGGGAVAQRKVFSLLPTGAVIRVVSPELTPGLQELAALGKVEYFQGYFDETDLMGCTLAFACTGDPEVNRRVCEAGREAGVLVNSADQPEACHFYLPAVLRRGDLTLAVSTGGSSPALARALKERLDRQFPPAYEKGLNILRKAREKIKEKYPEGEERSQALKALGSERFIRLIEEEQWALLEEEIAKWL